MSTEIFALVLAGGQSSRMQRDKAALPYGGRSQLERTVELAAARSARCFVSVRADQEQDPLRSRYSMLRDAVSGAGPLVGIRSALEAHPDKAWLVLACDLPFLTDAALRQLLKARDPTRLATAFRSAHDGLPEPLCTVWEPQAREPLAAFAASGRDCPRKFLINHDALLLDPTDRSALDNVNTPEEYARAFATLDRSA